MMPKTLGLLALAAATGVFCFAGQSEAEPPTQPTSTRLDAHRVPLKTAQERAEMMHDLFADSLDVIHHRYFRRDGAVLPARALEDVFDRVDERWGVKIHWISVNTPAMSINNEPTTAFEKKAAEELASGKSAYSRVENGYYYRAGPIPLDAGCVACHTRSAPITDKKPRFAGLVIAVPVKAE